MSFDRRFSLLTDLYQLTMANAFWRNGKQNQRAVFYMHIRGNPFGSGFTVFCGLELLLDALENYRFGKEELAYLSGLRDSSGNKLFHRGFLDFLKDFRFSLDIHSVPEGACVFPYEPLIRVEGGILECQLIETLLLNLVNFSSLIATKAARINLAAGGGPVLEFGLRRAQGPDGGVAASRAAYIGGCSATSNVAAGFAHGIPVKGSHSHSWITSFPDEREAFAAFGKTFPNDCIFLVDTFDSENGIRIAIEAARALPEPQKGFLGVRLDSGDLAYFSKKARRMLDEAGFPNAKVFASNGLDEVIIDSLKDQGAKINVWASGTKLVTGDGDSSLNGVYKLSALQDENGRWSLKTKITEDMFKIHLPGKLGVKRFYKDGKAVGDIVYDQLENPPDYRPGLGIDVVNPYRRFHPPRGSLGEDLLRPAVLRGEIVCERPSPSEIRERASEHLNTLDESIKRAVNPHRYPAGADENAYRNLRELLGKHRAGDS